MLYVFYADIGKTLTFDMNLVNETVLHLMQILERYLDAPLRQQALIISGGQCLSEDEKKDTRICSYSAGTDTNPIYFFNKQLLNAEIPWSMIGGEYKNTNIIDNELDQQFESIDNSTAPVTIYTVNRINQLAQKYVEQAMDMMVHCDQLNIDQLLQQQGWAAALAYLDERSKKLQDAYRQFPAMYERFYKYKSDSDEMLKNLEKTLEVLKGIPLIPGLLDSNDEERIRVETQIENVQPIPTTAKNLFDWVCAKRGPIDTVENLRQASKDILPRYHDDTFDEWKRYTECIFNEQRVKELKDNAEISQNLMNLSGLIVNMKDIVEDQKKRASGIKRNQERAADLNDDSILPDLVMTHRDTLRCMKANHTNLRTCRQLCFQAKKELCDIIHHKFWDLSELLEKIETFASQLKLAIRQILQDKQHIYLIRMIHTTPHLYLQAISEVVRRRELSHDYLVKSNEISYRYFTFISEETARRRKFRSQFSQHYLTHLFPGLDDMPPAFAIHPPPVFDHKLPALCIDDLKYLRSCVPEYASCFEFLDIEDLRRHFLSFSLNLDSLDVQFDDATNQQQDNQNTNQDNEDNVQNESHNETTVMPMDLDQSSSSSDCAAITHIQDADDKKALQSMRQRVAVVNTMAYNSVMLLKYDVYTLRDWILIHDKQVTSFIQALNCKWQHQRLGDRYLQQVNFISHAYGTMKEHVIKQLAEKDEKIHSLYDKVDDLQEKFNKLSTETDEEKQHSINELLEKQLQIEKEKITKEITEKLTKAHKSEIEELRARFKLMKNAASDTSLEKIERADVIELVNHEAIINQMKEDMKVEMEKAITAERNASQLKSNEELKKFNIKLDNEKQFLTDTIRTSAVEGYKEQIDTLRCRQTLLQKELKKHKDTIHMLTSSDRGRDSLLYQIEKLEGDKRRLEEELINERTTKYSFHTAAPHSSCALSLYSANDSGGSTTSLASNSSPELRGSRIQHHVDGSVCKKSRSTPCKPKQRQISITTCNIGDWVLVVWDDILQNYTILQESSTIHLLHKDCISILGLSPPSDGSPRKHYCPAEVVLKEYCAPKKTKNRYNLDIGEKFYRVQVLPLNNKS